MTKPHSQRHGVRQRGRSEQSDRTSTIEATGSRNVSSTAEHHGEDLVARILITRAAAFKVLCMCLLSVEKGRPVGRAPLC